MSAALRIHVRLRLAVGSVVSPVALLAAIVAGPAAAQDQVVTFRIPAQPLSASLLMVGRQGRLSVLAGQDLISGRIAPAVSGEMTARQALAQVLAGSGLTAEFVSGGAVRIAPSRAGRSRPAAEPRPVLPGALTPWEVEVSEVEPLVVTGTAIRGRSAQALPVTLLDVSQTSARQALTPIELLTALPQVGAIPLGESTSGSLTARGDNAAVNLRGIGSSATLVLLNGRRLAPHPISSIESGAPSLSVNVNQLPTRGLERIDVLRDGASSIYGSDAVAGVINFITSRRFRGTEARLRYGYPEEGGGKSWNVTLTHGRDLFDGRGRILATLDVLQRDKLFLNQRDVSATADHTARAPPPFNVAGSVFDGRPATLYPTFRVGAATASTYFRPLASLGGAPGFTSLAPSRAADPEAFLDVNRYQEIQPRSGRINGFAAAEYDLDGRATAFAELTIYRAHSQLIRNPVPFNAPNSDLPQVVSADNPYNPYGSRFYSPTGAANADGAARLVGEPQAVTLQSVLLADGGADTIDVDSQVYRVVGGVRGKVGETWTWETGWLYSWARSVDDTAVGFRESLLGQALAQGDAAAFNPFGYTFKIAGGQVVADQPYRNPASVLSTIMGHQTRTGETSIASLDLRASGALFRGWAGPVSAGVGGEFRRETFLDRRPAFFSLNPAGSGLDPNNNDFIQASPKPDSAGDRDVASVYLELVAPLVAPENRVPFVRSLELGASVRYERYSDFSDTTNPKFSLNWRPVPALTVRASRNRGFSAPNLATLSYPFQYSVIPAPGSIDPYRNPVTNEGAYVMRNYTGARRDLEPASSRGRSIGVVYELSRPGLGRLILSADYWSIAQRGLIASPTSQQVLNSDANLLRAYVEAQRAAGVAIDQIDLGSGASDYKGNPAVVRNPVTAADRASFAAYNALHPNAPEAVAGVILSRQTAYQNLAAGFVSGWDYSVEYVAPELPIGWLRLSIDWARLLKSYTLSPITAGAQPQVQQRLNIDGNTASRASATLSWRRARWTASLAAYHVGAYGDSNASTTAAVYESLGRPSYLTPVTDNGAVTYLYRVKATTSFNAAAGYAFASGAMVRLGVVNLTRVAPPLASGNFGYTASTYSGLAVGRTWTVELSRAF